ncbi:MAG: CopG family transcriptional regulator [Burkholderiaceae bacterium]
MRTTLDIDDDVYLHAREVARAEHQPIGKTISRFLRERFQSPTANLGLHGEVKTRNGFAVIPGAGRVVTQEAIQKIMDTEGI